ncbi:hypothetical protein RCL1_003478 [Eukaryota sp. TZLM3-RCL]
MNLPQSLLVNCLSKVLKLRQRSNSEESITYRTYHDYSLEHCYAILVKYGSVSWSFRSAVCDMISSFVSSHEQVLNSSKHCDALALLFQHVEPNSVPLLFDLDLCLPIDSDYITHLTMDFSEITNVSQFHSFLNDFEFPEVVRFTSNRMFALMFFKIYMSIFPKLKALSFMKCLCVDSDYVFPSSMNTLESLEVSDLFCRNNEAIILSFDVSNLTNLKSLSLSYQHGYTLIGLKSLAFLEELSLSFVHLFDELSPIARLSLFKLFNVSQQALSGHEFSPEIFKHCNVVIEGCRWEDSCCASQFLLSQAVKLSFKLPSLLPDLESPSWTNGLVFKSSQAPKVRDLEIDPSSFMTKRRATIVLANCPQLEALEVSGCEVTKLAADTVLYIRKLTLSNFKFKLMLGLIRRCSYLVHLHCNMLTGMSKYDFDVPNMNHLEYLAFDMNNNFYSSLPVLPKLKTLVVSFADDFSMNSLNCFPALVNLKLNKLDVNDFLEEPNYTIENLTIMSTYFYSDRFLLPFAKLKTLLMMDHHAPAQAETVSIIIPRTLQNLYLETLYRNFQHWEFSSSQLDFMAGNLYVNEEGTERQECEEKLLKFQSDFPNVFVKVNVVKDEVDDDYQFADVLYNISHKGGKDLVLS